MELKLKEIRDETHDTKSFIFDKPVGFEFVAGQLLHWMVPHENPDNRGVRRPISISASPSEDFLMFTTKFAPENGSTFKKKLLTVEPGFAVEVDEPVGSFILSREIETPVVLLGGGVGITPFRSMIKFSTDEHSPREITLLYANKTPADIIFRQEFDAWAEENPHFKVFYTVDTPDDKWSGEIGHLTGEMIQKYVPDPKVPLYYICGPAGMVSAYRQILTDLEVATDRIITENFTGYK